MNYIKCFNRSRAANCLQPVFVSGASMLARMEYYAPVPFAPVLVPRCWHGWSITPVCHLRPSWCLHAGTDGVLRSGASMLAWMEYYARVPFAPVLVPPCWHGWSITFWCLHAGMDGVLRPCAICARPGASMLARMEYYARVPFAPVLVPRCWHGWSITPVCHLRPSWCLDAGTDGVLQPVPLCAVPGASMLSGVECCSRCPFAPFLEPRCCQVWSVAAGAPLRRSWCRSGAPLHHIIYIMVYLRY